MMSAENLVMSYKKTEHHRVTGSKDIKVFYWSDKDSSDEEDNIINRQEIRREQRKEQRQKSRMESNDKLEANISKYIKKKSNGKR